ncbi:hypothetical protein BY458DRAFT_495272 [Sporodiniella umbellata]|nr:hypothetical protein BY458DRAFT_495272 [Sporodiniella umbellata]
MNSIMLKHNSRSSPENNNRCNRKLSAYSRTELYQLREKNLQMLNNNAILRNLSDKGARLKETNDLIDDLLEDQRKASSFDIITTENTLIDHCPLTKKLENMSLLTARQGARKKSIDIANHQALYSDRLNRRLLKYGKLSAHQSSEHDKVKSRMITLDESLMLQRSKYEDALDVENPSKKLLETLNLSWYYSFQKDSQEYEFPTKELIHSEAYTQGDDMITDE